MLRGVARASLPAELAPRHVTDARAHEPIADAHWIRTFADAMGNRRRVDRPLLAHLAHAKPGPTPALSDLDPEEGVWWALHDPAALNAAAIDFTAHGPLFPTLRQRGIEWWTQAELSGVHALSILAQQRNDPAIAARVDRNAMWLLDEVQPDNATQWPWAVHVFATIAIQDHRAPSVRTAARHYAQTLVHNAIVNTGSPDPFAACILWSSANWLESSIKPGSSDA